jgi:outer membrane protein TolC
MKSMAVAVLLIVFAPTTVAQTYLPPPEVTDRVLSSHPDTQTARQLLTASESQARKLAAGPHEWTLSGNYTQRSVRAAGNFPEQELLLSRAFRLPGKAALDRQIGKLGIDVAENAAEDARHQVALSLMQGWMGWLTASEAEATAGAQVSQFRKEVQIAEGRLRAGTGTEIDLELARGALAEAEVTAARSTGLVAQSGGFLSSWFPDLPLPARPLPIEAPPTLAPDDDWAAKILHNSHEIAMAEFEARRAEAEVRRVDEDRMPDPTFGVRTFRERGGEETGFGLTFSIPIGGSARSQAVSHQAALAGAARSRLDRTRRSIADTAHSDVALARSERAAWVSARAALDQSERAVARVRRGYELQATDLADLVVAERRHSAIQLLEAEARARAATAWLKLRIDAHELWLD